MKRLYSITIHGKHKTWSHLVWANPEHVTDWRQDGIEVDEVVAVVPERVGLIPLEW